MKTPSALALLIFSAALAASSTAQQQKAPAVQEAGDEEVVRVNTTLVTIPVSVLDRNGKFVPDLRREDFHVYEDGVEQEIAYFETAESPFTVALILDKSDSTVARFDDIKRAAIAFLEQLRPDDRVMLVAFDKNVHVEAEPTSDRAVLRAAIERLKSGGSTSLYSAVALTVGERLSRVRGRKAVVLFTDGVDTASRKDTYETTLRAAEEVDALVYAIQYETYDDVRMLDGARGVLVTAKGETLDVAYKRANLYLHLLADKTGGDFLHADSPKNLSRTFARVAEQLRQQYSIGFYPKRAAQGAQKRSLRVRVGVNNVAVRARKSYLAR